MGPRAPPPGDLRGQVRLDLRIAADDHASGLPGHDVGIHRGPGDHLERLRAGRLLRAAGGREADDRGLLLVRQHPEIRGLGSGEGTGRTVHLDREAFHLLAEVVHGDGGRDGRARLDLELIRFEGEIGARPFPLGCRAPLLRAAAAAGAPPSWPSQRRRGRPAWPPGRSRRRRSGRGRSPARTEARGCPGRPAGSPLRSWRTAGRPGGCRTRTRDSQAPATPPPPRRSLLGGWFQPDHRSVNRRAQEPVPDRAAARGRLSSEGGVVGPELGFQGQPTELAVLALRRRATRSAIDTGRPSRPRGRPRRRRRTGCCRRTARTPSAQNSQVEVGVARERPAEAAVPERRRRRRRRAAGSRRPRPAGG